MADTVDLQDFPVPKDALWRPAAGSAVQRFLDGTGLDLSARQAVRERAISILGACVPPTMTGAPPRTGLVVGYVQSGKTQSFTALTALARDAGYPLVILLAGTKLNLHRQTADRLRDDLHANGGQAQWIFVENLSPGSAKYAQIESVLRSHTDAESLGKRPRTVVTTVMKNPSSVSKLTTVLLQLSASGALSPSTPILIIDDEADQAGLNTKPKTGATPTYAAITAMREAAGTHSYIMYTATPQAPLLLHLTDMLSPDFVRVLSPGDSYTGGEHFFGEARDDFVRHIPDEEVLSIGSNDFANLSTLEVALAYFLLAVVAERTDQARSMLVHPSRSKESHKAIHRWIESRLKGFESAISAGGVDRQDVVDLAFTPAWEDLATTVDDLPPLESLLDDVPSLIKADLAIRTVNSTNADAEQLDWYEASAWIIVGGFKLDRGFTVEGLTVTWMPRGVGVGNADSIQQRARFFGYKGAYAEYCRAWLEGRLEGAYVAYVEHERHLLEELRKVERAAQGLKAWKRRMLLDPDLKPCRSSVVTLPHVRTALKKDGWLQLGYLSASDYAHNRNLVDALPWTKATRHEADTRPNVPDTGAHQSLLVSARDALDHVLARWKVAGTDAARLYQVAIVLANVADATDTVPVDLVLMDNGSVRRRAFVEDESRVENFHVGRSAGYEGDREVRTEGHLTLQFHVVENSATGEGPMVGMAMYLPSALSGGVLYEVDV